MPYNGSGSYSRLYSWVDDRDDDIKIRADRMDAEDDGFATGLSTAITKDGQTTPTANLPMGGFKHTGVADGSARSHYPAVGQIQDGEFLYGGTAGGTADALTITVTPNIIALETGMVFRVKAAGTNTGNVTVNANSIGATALKYKGAQLPVGALNSGDMFDCIYDGTALQMLTPPRLTYASSGANTDITSVYLNNTGLKIKDTNASHGLSIVPGSNITADRAFNLVTGDADRTLTMTGNLAMSGAFNLTLTITADTNVTLPITGTLATLAGAETLTNKTIGASQLTGALPAISGASLTSLNASNLASGTVPDARFPATLPAASGANLTALNASNLSSGTVPEARMSTTLPSSKKIARVTSGSAANSGLISWGTGAPGALAEGEIYLRYS